MLNIFHSITNCSVSICVFEGYLLEDVEAK